MRKSIRMQTLSVFLLIGLFLRGNGQALLIIDSVDSIMLQPSEVRAGEAAINTYVIALVQEGYVYAGLDSVWTQPVRTYFLHRGPKYAVNLTQIRAVDQEITRARHLKDEPILRAKEIVSQAADQGYPFAQVRLDSIWIRDQQANLIMEIDYGPYITYDTLSPLGTIKTKTSFLWTALNFTPGRPYREADFQSITRRIRGVEFLSLYGTPDIAFGGGKAKIFLPLTERRTNQFDGIIGLLPNQQEDGGPLVTGYLALQLNNLFRSGKRLDFFWQRFQFQSQQLNISYDHPYLLHSPLSLSTSFDLLRQDSSFLNRRIAVALESTLKDRLHIGFEYENEGSAAIGSAQSDIVGYQTHWYGLRAFSSRRSAIQTNENQGRFNVQAMLGTKKMDLDDSISNVSFNTLRMRMVAAYQFQLTGRHAIYLANRAGWLSNKNLIINELDRLGGLQTLRGFNENEFYVSGYAVQQLEYRLYFEQRSFLNAFLDVGYLENALEGQGFNYWTRAIGAGMNLGVNNGYFRFIFAAGMHKELPFDVQNTKIHFGYAANF